MLSTLNDFAAKRDIDFIILISDLNRFYEHRGYRLISTQHSWLRIDEHNNHGVATEWEDELFVKPIKTEKWPAGNIDWLGYRY